MAFRPFGTLNPHGAPVLRSEILANSITVVHNDCVIATSGFVALGTTGTLVLGFVDSISTNMGVGVQTSGAAGAAMGSFVGTFLTASDNQTVAKVRAQVDISKFTLRTGSPDSDIATTTGSGLLGYHTDILDEDDVDESTAATTAAQLTIWGVDPSAATTRGVYSIYESVVFGV